MLRAIGFYEVNKDPQTHALHFKKLNSAQIGQNRFFTENLLKDFENKTTKQILPSDLTQTNILHYQTEGEHHYVKRLDDQTHVMVLVSRTPIDPREATNLFINTAHAIKRPDSTHVTLQQIVDNPLGYTGKNHQIEKIQQDLEETKDILIKGMERILERGEQIEMLSDKTIKLSLASKEFEEGAKKLNKKCCW